MDRGLKPVIRVDEEKCVNCHTCIAVCPVKFCIDGSGDRVKVRSELCIGCGSCIKACTHGARSGIDDLDAFLTALARGERMVAIVAPAVAARYPDSYLRLNGWLGSLGVEAVFDVAFGAELTVESYLQHVGENKPSLVIAQPCPAIVSYIELYQPELLPYLAPAQSPMLHTLVMIKTFYPEYRDRKILIVSPCVAKRREFDETGLGDYNVTLERLSEYLDAKGIRLEAYPERPFEGPLSERAVLFSSPGGLKATVERENPDVAHATRKLEGPTVIYPYLKELPLALSAGVAPLLIDCLNCEKGCNGGTGTGLADKPVDILEAAVKARDRSQREKNKGKGIRHRDSAKEVRKAIKRYWKSGIYDRRYVDRSASARISMPSEVELAAIYQRMHKFREEDFLNCSACGYGTCKDMAVAIHNGLNKPDNCQHYRLLVLKESKEALEQMAHDLDQEISRSATLLATLKNMLPELDQRTSEQSLSLEEATNKIVGLLAQIERSSTLSGTRRTELEALRGSATKVQADLNGSLAAVRALRDQMAGIHNLVAEINKLSAQTNLLSMNAAIEAAHAGDSGRGFAVVAAEIRGLADQSGKSSSQISKTLADMTKGMAATTSSTEKSGSSIRGVLGELEQSATGMDEIFSSLASVSRDTGDIGSSIKKLADVTAGVKETYRRMEEALKTTTEEIGAIARISRDNIKKIADL